MVFCKEGWKEGGVVGYLEITQRSFFSLFFFFSFLSSLPGDMGGKNGHGKIGLGRNPEENSFRFLFFLSFFLLFLDNVRQNAQKNHQNDKINFKNLRLGLRGILNNPPPSQPESPITKQGLFACLFPALELDLRR